MSREKKKIMDPFQKWAHSWGRVGTVIALIYMITLPFVICIAFDCMPKFTDVINASTVGILLIYIPVVFQRRSVTFLSWGLPATWALSQEIL